MMQRCSIPTYDLHLLLVPHCMRAPSPPAAPPAKTKRKVSRAVAASQKQAAVEKRPSQRLEG
jgi:hypothetical protein